MIIVDGQWIDEHDDDDAVVCWIYVLTVNIDRPIEWTTSEEVVVTFCSCLSSSGVKLVCKGESSIVAVDYASGIPTFYFEDTKMTLMADSFHVENMN